MELAFSSISLVVSSTFFTWAAASDSACSRFWRASSSAAVRARRASDRASEVTWSASFWAPDSISEALFSAASTMDRTCSAAAEAIDDAAPSLGRERLSSSTCRAISLRCWSTSSGS